MTLHTPTIVIIGDGIASLAGIYNIARRLPVPESGNTEPTVNIDIIGPAAGSNDWGKGPAYTSPGVLNGKTETIGLTSLREADNVHKWMTHKGFLTWLEDDEGYPAMLRGEKGERLRQEAEKYKDLSEKFALGRSYLPRRLNGLYIEAIREIVEQEAKNKGVTLHTHQTKALDIDIDTAQSQASVILENGEAVRADLVLDASGTGPLLVANVPGMETLGENKAIVKNPWTDLPQSLKESNGTIVIFGTGLSFVDKAMELDEAGYFNRGGKVIAVSNHAFIPQPHATVKTKLPHTFLPDMERLLAQPEITALEFKRFVDKYTVRTLAGGEAKLDGNGISELKEGWQDAMGAIHKRHHEIWSKFPEDQKALFFERYFGHWKALRNRIAPEHHERIQELTASGAIELRPGSIKHITAASEQGTITVDYVAKGRKGLAITETPQTLEGIQGFINCTGPNRNVEEQTLHKNLLAKGLIQPGPVHMGVRLAEDHFSAAGSNGILFPLSGELQIGEKFEINGWLEGRQWNEQVTKHVISQLGLPTSIYERVTQERGSRAVNQH